MSSGNKFIGWFWAGLSRSFVGDKIDREPAYKIPMPKAGFPITNY